MWSEFRGERRGRVLAILALTVGVLMVGTPSAMAGDNFADPSPLPLGTGDFGSISGASFETNEPDHNPDGNSGGAFWYHWPATVTGAVTLDTCFSLNDPDTVLAVYTGAQAPATPGWTLTPVASNDDGCGPNSFGSRVRFDAVNGTLYHFALASAIPSQGGANTFELQFNQAPVNDDLEDATLIPGTSASISVSNLGATPEAGEPSHGGPGGSSVWYKWTAPSTDPVSIQTCSTTFDTRLAVYTAPNSTPSLGQLNQELAGSNECGQQESIEFTPDNGETYWIAIDGVDSVLEPGGDTGTIQLTLNTEPANNDYANRQVLGGFPASVSGSTAAADLEGGEPAHGTNTRSVWYQWTATLTGPVAFRACDSNTSFGPTRVDVYVVGVTPGFPGLTPTGATTGCDGNGQVTLNAVSGTVYAIALSSSFGGPTELVIESATDTVAPDTTIDKLTVKSPRRKAILKFTGTDPVSTGGPSLPLTFECKLDAKPYAPCTSPAKFKKLKVGRHKLSVRAVDDAGNKDASAAKKSFRIRRR